MTACRTLFVAMAAALAATSAGLSLARWGGVVLATLVWEGRRAEALDQRLTASHLVVETKTRVVNELIAGRLTLREAADRFGELSALVAGDGNDDMIGAYRVVSGEEALCHSVLLWAEVALRHEPDPSAAAAVLARLRAAYRERFGRDPEPMPLPASPSPWPEDAAPSTPTLPHQGGGRVLAGCPVAPGLGPGQKLGPHQGGGRVLAGCPRPGRRRG